MVKGTTKTGFKFSVDPDAIRDMEFVELAAAVEDNGMLLPKMIELVLGAKQKQKLYDHVRNDKGRVMIDDINDEIKEIFDALKTDKETKNS